MNGTFNRRLAVVVMLVGTLGLATAAAVAGATRVETKVRFTVSPETGPGNFNAVVNGTVTAGKGCRSGRSIVVEGSRSVGSQVFSAPSVSTRSSADGSFTATLEMPGGSGAYQYVVRVSAKTIKKKGVRCQSTLFDVYPSTGP